MIQRSLKVKLSLSNEDKETLLETMEEYSKCFNFYSNWSSTNKSTSKKVAHSNSYQESKKLFPSLPTALIQSARDLALESNKNKRSKSVPIKKKHSSIRYDIRTFALRNQQLTLSSTNKRIKTIISLYPYIENYFKNWKLLKTGYLSKVGKHFYFTFLFESDKTKETQESKRTETVGLDRGIINVIATSEGELVSGKLLRKNKRKYLYLRRKLQAKGTRSAKRFLKRISRKEKRFSLDFLHCLSKKLIKNENVKTYVLENLSRIKPKKYNKKSNKVVSNWGFKQFETLLKYKAEQKGINVEFADPMFTSQICSGCQNQDKNSRNKGMYRCGVCKLRIHSDVNAAKNIKNRFLLTEKKQSFPSLSLEQGVVNPPNVNNKKLSFASS
ncbi:MAG TPA: transposase [Leptospiraceae bacterium]|nr:transposase [Leptospiraceae bacterium]